MSKHVPLPSGFEAIRPFKQKGVGGMVDGVTCWLGRRPTLVNGPAVTVTSWFAGKATLAFTVGVPERLTGGREPTVTGGMLPTFTVGVFTTSTFWGFVL